MAIYSAVPPPPALHSQSTAQPQNASSQQQQQPASVAPGAVDIEAWTISALEALSVSPIAAGTTGRPLSIPLDEHANNAQATTTTARVTIATADGNHAPIDAITPPRRPPSRRDSLRRRQLLLIGKEGSRQRRRYDMKRLTDVPNVEPPEPRDWEPRPVYPVHHVPYHVAGFWERGLSEAAAARDNKKNRANNKAGTAGRVPRELRDTVKRTPGVKGWLRALEEPVREFLAERHRAAGEAPVAEDESDESDDEVVFVGRKKAAAAVGPRDASSASSTAWMSAHREVRDGPAVDRGMVFHSSPDDDDGSSAFKRWLTHSISDYYGLVSRSVTVGSPGRRCVYVGVRDVDLKIRTSLPRPLWELF